ncbi:unnamed protein product, partial [Diabrotica balteata]
ITIKHCCDYKYLGITISQDETLEKAIREINTSGRKAIIMLNNILWDQSISKRNKNRIYETIVKSITLYCKVWPLKERTLTTLKATEIILWRIAARRSRRGITNERIREIMGIKRTITDDLTTKQLIWFGNIQR